jgi:hypothetical protein
MSRSKIRPEFAPGAKITIEIVRPPEEGFLIVRFLGEPRGIYQHWIRGKGRHERSKGQACPGEEACGKFHQQNCPEWVGFASVERWRPGQYQDWCPCVLQVSEGLQQRLAGHELRGTQWKVFKVLGRHGKMECTGEQLQEDDPDEYPAADNVEPAVCLAYKTKYIKWDVELVMPQAQIREASRGAPPPVSVPVAKLSSEDEPRMSAEEARKVLEERKARLGNSR